VWCGVVDRWVCGCVCVFDCDKGELDIYSSLLIVQSICLKRSNNLRNNLRNIPKMSETFSQAYHLVFKTLLLHCEYSVEL
jgi:hypothetical protein